MERAEAPHAQEQIGRDRPSIVCNRNPFVCLDLEQSHAVLLLFVVGEFTEPACLTNETTHT